MNGVRRDLKHRNGNGPASRSRLLAGAADGVPRQKSHRLFPGPASGSIPEGLHPISPSRSGFHTGPRSRSRLWDFNPRCLTGNLLPGFAVSHNGFPAKPFLHSTGLSREQINTMHGWLDQHIGKGRHWVAAHTEAGADGCCSILSTRGTPSPSSTALRAACLVGHYARDSRTEVSALLST